MEEKFYTKEEVVDLVKSFFYEGMTFEQFNGSGKNEPEIILHQKLLQKDLIEIK